MSKKYLLLISFVLVLSLAYIGYGADPFTKPVADRAAYPPATRRHRQRISAQTRRESGDPGGTTLLSPGFDID